MENKIKGHLMKKSFLFTLIFLITCLTAYAETTKYLAENPDGSVRVIYYVPGSVKTIDQVLTDLGVDKSKVKEIKSDDIPGDRTDRKYWKAKNGKIEIDANKKQADIDSKLAKKAEKDAVLSKLKISDEELDKLHV
jgi:hypothetical protein